MPFEDDKPKETENSPFEAPSVMVVAAPIGAKKSSILAGSDEKCSVENSKSQYSLFS